MGIIDFLTIILLLVAIITLAIMGWETSLTRKQMRGEVYDKAKVKDCISFCRPRVSASSMALDSTTMTKPL